MSEDCVVLCFVEFCFGCDICVSCSCIDTSSGKSYVEIYKSHEPAYVIEVGKLLLVVHWLGVCVFLHIVSQKFLP